MMDHHPSPVRLATNLGWVRGSLALPNGSTLLEELNRHDGLLRLTDTFVPARRERLAFFAVRVGSVSLLLPEATAPAAAPAAVAPAPQAYDPLDLSWQLRGRADPRAAAALARHKRPAAPQRRVLLLLDKVSVTGAVETTGQTRVSDVFVGGRSFVRVAHASLHADRGGGATDLLDTVPEVYVNVLRIHAIADLDDGNGAELDFDHGPAGRGSGRS